MAHINDVGGLHGFGPIEREEDEPPFHADWEARVFALHLALLRAEIYNMDEFRYAIERMDPDDYLASSYYERWLTAIETLLEEKGTLSAQELPQPRPASTPSGDG